MGNIHTVGPNQALIVSGESNQNLFNASQRPEERSIYQILFILYFKKSIKCRNSGLFFSCVFIIFVILKKYLINFNPLFEGCSNLILFATFYSWNMFCCRSLMQLNHSKYGVINELTIHHYCWYRFSWTVQFTSMYLCGFGILCGMKVLKLWNSNEQSTEFGIVPVPR